MMIIIWALGTIPKSQKEPRRVRSAWMLQKSVLLEKAHIIKSVMDS